MSFAWDHVESEAAYNGFPIDGYGSVFQDQCGQADVIDFFAMVKDGGGITKHQEIP